jgi:N-acetylmuramoyl-L-alanine amidase
MAKIKICLDAGHYGKYNRSPVNKAYYESEMNWKLHLLLKAELEKHGIEVITTRSNKAKDLELTSRGKKAKGCDLFLSLHSNACDTESVDRVVAIYLVPDADTTHDEKSKPIAEKLAAVVAEVMGTKDKPKTYSKLASGDRDGDGKKDDNYYGVLHGADSVGVPAVILEHSFHTNKRAADWLLIDSNLDKLAKAEAEVLAEHFGVKKAEEKNEQFTSYKVKVTASALNVRKGPGTKHKIVTVVHRGDVYTIVGEENGWGRLKSGAGFISLAYTKKI